MLLAIDVGNTNVVFGLFRDHDETPIRVWRMTSRRDRTADEWYALLSPLLEPHLTPEQPITGSIMSTVVPVIGDALALTISNHLSLTPMMVSVDLDLGIRVSTDAPHETGTDRIVNAVAAFARFGGPAIIVDLGTATKIEAITAEGEFVGGTIAPGLGLSLDALATRAARLYAVTLQRPSSVVGRNTVTAVQSGVVEGHLAMIEGIVNRMREELGGVSHVVLTGGYAPVFADVSSVFTDVVPGLTLDGLRLIYRRNRH